MDPITSEGSPELHVVGLRIETDGVYLDLRCTGCGHAFEDYQTTVGGIGIGRHTCPKCRTYRDIWPEDFEAILEQFLPVHERSAMIQLTEEATHITETWYRDEPWIDLLDYGGVNFGESLEREFMAIVLQGLMMGCSARGSK